MSTNVTEFDFFGLQFYLKKTGASVDLRGSWRRGDGFVGLSYWLSPDTFYGTDPERERRRQASFILSKDMAETKAVVSECHIPFSFSGWLTAVISWRKRDGSEARSTAAASFRFGSTCSEVVFDVEGTRMTAKLRSHQWSITDPQSVRSRLPDGLDIAHVEQQLDVAWDTIQSEILDLFDAKSVPSWMRLHRHREEQESMTKCAARLAPLII